jgi:hypothetical protein
VDYAGKGAIDLLTAGLSKEVAADGLRRPSGPASSRPTFTPAADSRRAERLEPRFPRGRSIRPPRLRGHICLCRTKPYVNGATDVTGGR